MSFDASAFNAKAASLAQAWAGLSTLIQAAHALAPSAPGLAKASLVIDAAVQLEPALVTMVGEMQPLVTNVVNLLRASNQLPAPQIAK